MNFVVNKFHKLHGSNDEQMNKGKSCIASMIIYLKSSTFVFNIKDNIIGKAYKIIR